LGAFSKVSFHRQEMVMATMNFGKIWHGAARRAAIVLVAACAASVLVACSSGTKLNDVAVEDRAGKLAVPKPVTPASGAAGSGSEVGERAVQPGTLDTAQNSAAGPANAAKVIYFDYDSYAIKPEFQSAIDAHAKFLNSNKTRKMAIEGHTDERGGREYNLALGQKRSEAVRRALALLGVTEAQLEAVSFGKEKPANPGSDEAAWALNRRAEINYR
jgi:peptidoglycan-associated lipoprotein